MDVKRAVMIGVAGVAVAVWISAAATSNTRNLAPVIPTKPNVVDKSGAELAVEVKRLHERLRPSDPPVHSRDLFRYAARPSTPAVPAPGIPVAPPPSQQPLAAL